MSRLEGLPPRDRRWLAVVMAAILAVSACRQTTARLPADLLGRLEVEGIVRRADDQVFRYTYYSRSTHGTRWEDRAASIIVTRQRLFIHKNGKVGVDLGPTGRKEREVRRDGDRVIVSVGAGQSRVSWSFRPPEDPEGWAVEIRRAVTPGEGP